MKILQLTRLQVHESEFRTIGLHAAVVLLWTPKSPTTILLAAGSGACTPAGPDPPRHDLQVRLRTAWSYASWQLLHGTTHRSFQRC